MAKWHGKIGYVKMTEIRPGVWGEEVTEKEYYGDVNRITHRWQAGSSLNDNLNISNEFSILADGFANENCQYMRYIEFMGGLWEITSVEVQRPRLILSVGGVYNGEQT